MNVWDDLRESFSKVDRVRITTLRYSFNNLKQNFKIDHGVFS